MARPKKRRTLEEMDAQVSDAAMRRQDAEARLKTARKNEEEAIRQRNALLEEERMKRMNVLLANLAELGYPMDTDEDIAAITEIISTSGNVSCGESQIMIRLKDLVEHEAGIHLTSTEDIDRLETLLKTERNIQKRKTSISRLIRDTAADPQNRAAQHPGQMTMPIMDT